MKWKFYKYSATGNDFIMMDDRNCQFPVEDGNFIKSICTRRQGAGADGLILIQSSERAAFRMRYFNSDGKEAEMCGNGARSAIKFAHSLGIINEHTSFQTHLDLHEGMIQGETIKVKMNQPGNIRWGEQLGGMSTFEEGGYVEIGVPHYVLFATDITHIDVQRIGAELAHNDAFPKGTNVNFVKVTSSQSLEMRTYERGVEAETLSCGTGATASAIIASKIKGVSSPVTVSVPGGALTVAFDQDYKQVWLSGPVDEIYRAELMIKPSVVPVHGHSQME